MILQLFSHTAVRQRRCRSGVAVGFGCVVALIASGCTNSSASQQPQKSAEVVVTQPVTDEVTDYQEFTGRLDAFKAVEVRAHVSGFIQEAPFKEGDYVHAGDLLFQIDPRTYDADFNQAEANLKLAIAERKFQERNVERARFLYNQHNNAISREDADQAQAALEKAQANVGAMEAAKARTKVYLDYTRITAFQSGRISRRFVDPGNLVRADETALTTIVADDPIYVFFDVDERTYLDLAHTGSTGPGSHVPISQLKVEMRLVNEDKFIRTGTVDFVDNRVAGNTGTIRLRGLFANADHYLKPGMFVRVRLPITQPYRAVLVPEETLLSDQGRRYVYVVNEKNEAVYRSVKLGQAAHGKRVVKEGLKEGERIILSGMQRVRPGAKVEIKAAKDANSISTVQAAGGDKTPSSSSGPAADAKGPPTPGLPSETKTKS